MVNSTQIDEEIIIIDDYSNKQTEEVMCYERHLQLIVFIGIRKLDGLFSDHKNYGIEKSSGDYIFHIDVDEYPHDILLLDNSNKSLEINDVDLIWMRVNTLEGMTEEHIKKVGMESYRKSLGKFILIGTRVFT